MSEINVTPFVDVMLVLLIIFMVTAPMMMQGEEVSLPETASDSLKADENPLVITIQVDGAVYINDFPVSTDFLKEKMTHILANRDNDIAYIRADESLPYGRVMRIMTEIKEAGVGRIGMITRPDEGAPAVSIKPETVADSTKSEGNDR
jgi:biopolymer transport protein TolR